MTSLHDQATVMTQRPKQGRRGFLVLLTGLFSAAIAALAAVPILGTVASPLLRYQKTKKEGPVPLAQLHELEAGVPKRVEIIQRSVDAWSAQDATVMGAVWLLKSNEGNVTAFSTLCPHLGCGVNYDAGAFKCPCHTSSFKLDGTVTGGPSPRPMDNLDVEVRDNRVYVRYARFKQGTSEREEV
jgi:menaquinol-cytochrome c reductase iron-sulfur subunit